jgi:predicted glycoside hydrolase/deacetylase ChbG (UPF0249 family)
MKKRKLLLVVADDFGVNSPRTRGILTAQHLLSHASLLLNGAAAEEAAYAAAASGLPLALHFNITEGQPLPVTSARSNPLLDKSTGHFLGKAPLLQLLHGREEKRDSAPLVDAVMEQLEIQVGRFVALTGIRSVALDGHHHVQCLPLVADAICNFFASSSSLAEGISLRYLRIPFDPSLPAVTSSRFLEQEDCFGMPFWSRVSMLASKMAAAVGPVVAAQSQGFLPDCMIGFDFMGDRFSSKALVEKLRSLPTSATVVELMTHIGFPLHPRSPRADNTHFWADAFSQDDGRACELRVLMSDGFRAVLESEGWSLPPRRLDVRNALGKL